MKDRENFYHLREHFSENSDAINADMIVYQLIDYRDATGEVCSLLDRLSSNADFDGDLVALLIASEHLSLNVSWFEQGVRGAWELSTGTKWYKTEEEVALIQSQLRDSLGESTAADIAEQIYQCRNMAWKAAFQLNRTGLAHLGALSESNAKEELEVLAHSLMAVARNLQQAIEKHSA